MTPHHITSPPTHTHILSLSLSIHIPAHILNFFFFFTQVYMATHHMFMSKGALYIIVVDLSSKKAEPLAAHILEWLEALQMHVPGSKVAIVGTHLDDIMDRFDSKSGRMFVKGMLSVVDEKVREWLAERFSTLCMHLQDAEDDLTVSESVWEQLKARRDAEIDEIQQSFERANDILDVENLGGYARSAVSQPRSDSDSDSDSDRKSESESECVDRKSESESGGPAVNLAGDEKASQDGSCEGDAVMVMPHSDSESEEVLDVIHHASPCRRPPAETKIDSESQSPRGSHKTAKSSESNAKDALESSKKDSESEQDTSEAEFSSSASMDSEPMDSIQQRLMRMLRKCDDSESEDSSQGQDPRMDKDIHDECSYLHFAMSQIEKSIADAATTTSKGPEDSTPSEYEYVCKLRRLITHQPSVLFLTSVSCKTHQNIEDLRLSLYNIGRKKSLFPSVGAKVPLNYLMLEQYCLKVRTRRYHGIVDVTPPQWEPLLEKHLETIEVDRRDRLQDMLSRPYVKLPELRVVASECNIEGEELVRALEFLHEAGSVLFYGQSAGYEELKDAVFTQPQWIIDAIKQVVHASTDDGVNDEIRRLRASMTEEWRDRLNALEHEGKLCAHLLGDAVHGLWAWEPELRLKYPRSTHNVLIALMKTFKLMREARCEEGQRRKWCQVCYKQSHWSYVVPAMFGNKSLLSENWTGPESVWRPRECGDCKHVFRRQYKGLRLKSGLVSRLQIEWSVEGEVHGMFAVEEARNGSVLRSLTDGVQETVVVSFLCSGLISDRDTVHIVAWSVMLDGCDDSTWADWRLFEHVVNRIDQSIKTVAGLNVDVHVPYVDDHGVCLELVPLQKIMAQKRRGASHVPLLGGQKHCMVKSLLPERTRLEPTHITSTTCTIAAATTAAQRQENRAGEGIHQATSVGNAHQQHSAGHAVSQQHDHVAPHSSALRVLMFSCRHASCLLDIETEGQNMYDLFDLHRSNFRLDRFEKPEMEKHFYGTLERMYHDRESALLHFSGHADDRGGLFFYAPGGGGQTPNRSKALARAMQLKLQALELVPLVFINACSTYNSGLALCRVGIKHVVCWMTPVRDSLSIEFAKAFYTQLCKTPHEYKLAFELACLPHDHVFTTEGALPCLLFEPGSGCADLTWGDGDVVEIHVYLAQGAAGAQQSVVGGVGVHQSVVGGHATRTLDVLGKQQHVDPSDRNDATSTTKLANMAAEERVDVCQKQKRADCSDEDDALDILQPWNTTSEVLRDALGSEHEHTDQYFSDENDDLSACYEYGTLYEVVREDIHRNWREPKGANDFAAHAGQAERRCIIALWGQEILVCTKTEGASTVKKGILDQDTLEVLGVKKYSQLFGKHGVIVAKALAMITDRVYDSEEACMHVMDAVENASSELMCAVGFRNQDISKHKVQECTATCSKKKLCVFCTHAHQLRLLVECNTSLQQILTGDGEATASLLAGTHVFASAKGYGDWRGVTAQTDTCIGTRTEVVSDSWEWSRAAGFAERRALEALGFVTVMGTPPAPMCVGNGVHRNGWLTNSALDVLDSESSSSSAMVEHRKQYFELFWSKDGLAGKKVREIEDFGALQIAMERVSESCAHRRAQCKFKCGVCTHCAASEVQKSEFACLEFCRQQMRRRLATLQKTQ
jgi:hypothetical protein